MTTNSYHLGIDPDLQLPALSIIRGQEVVFVSKLKTSKSTGEKAVVEVAQRAVHWLLDVPEMAIASVTVENQQIYAGKTKNPQQIKQLAAVAGALLASCSMVWPDAELRYPLPREWKKGTPKRIHQARILSRLGIEHEAKGGRGDGYCVPSWGIAPAGAEDLNPGDYKHVVDAIGLAAWGQSQ